MESRFKDPQIVRRWITLRHKREEVTGTEEAATVAATVASETSVAQVVRDGTSVAEQQGEKRDIIS